MDKERRDLTQGSIVKNLWILAIPMMATNALQTVFNIVDMMFVGRLGAAPVAAVSIVGNILMILFALILGISIATGAMVSRSFGAKDFDNVNHVALQSMIFGAYLGLFLSIIGYFIAPYLINIFGVELDVHNMATVYMRILFAGSIPMALSFLSASIFQAVGDAKTAMWIMLVAVLLNAIMDPLLIFGLGPFPRLEVAGAAWATTLARTVGMVIAILFLIVKKTHLHIKWESYKIDWDLLRRIAKIGFPGSLQMGLRSATGIIMMAIVAGYGTVALAAFGIGIRVDMLVMMPGFGLAAATATLVGQNLGAGEPDRAVKSTWLALVFFVSIMATAGIIYFTHAAGIFKLFTGNEEVIHNGVNYLRIMVLSYPFIAMAVIFNRGLSGAGETLWPMIITAFSLLCVAVPLSFIVPRIWNVGVNGVWIAVVISNFVNAIIIWSIFARGKWKVKKL